MLPHIFLFRFHNILVPHQAVPLTFYNKIPPMIALHNFIQYNIARLYNCFD